MENDKFFILRYHDGASPLPNTSDLLALLHTNSPLSLIHRYLDIQTIDSAEILEKLQKTIVDIGDDNDKQSQRKGTMNFAQSIHIYISLFQVFVLKMIHQILMNPFVYLKSVHR